MAMEWDETVALMSCKLILFMIFQSSMYSRFLSLISFGSCNPPMSRFPVFSEYWYMYCLRMLRTTVSSVSVKYSPLLS